VAADRSLGQTRRTARGLADHTQLGDVMTDCITHDGIDQLDRPARSSTIDRMIDRPDGARHDL
jgi:hypothetical protein